MIGRFLHPKHPVRRLVEYIALALIAIGLVVIAWNDPMVAALRGVKPKVLLRRRAVWSFRKLTTASDTRSRPIQKSPATTW